MSPDPDQQLLFFIAQIFSISSFILPEYFLFNEVGTSPSIAVAMQQALEDLHACRAALPDFLRLTAVAELCVWGNRRFALSRSSFSKSLACDSG